MYRREPAKTIPAPAVSSAFHPLPNHQTLMQRLIALRAVSTRFVDTDVTRWEEHSVNDWSSLASCGTRTYRGELVHS